MGEYVLLGVELVSECSHQKELINSRFNVEMSEYYTYLVFPYEEVSIRVNIANFNKIGTNKYEIVGLEGRYIAEKL